MVSRSHDGLETMGLGLSLILKDDETYETDSHPFKRETKKPAPKTRLVGGAI